MTPLSAHFCLINSSSQPTHNFLIDYITANCTIERNNTPSSSSLQYIHHGAFPPPYYYSVISVAAATTTTDHHRRLNVLPTQSIATEIQTAHDAGNWKPRFTLHAADESSPPPATAVNNNNIFSASTSTTTGTSELLFEVHVREAEPAITSKTTISVKGGKAHYVDSNNFATMLVSEEVGVLALLSVDKKDGKVNGIVKKGKSVTKKFTQKSSRRGEKVRSSS